VTVGNLISEKRTHEAHSEIKDLRAHKRLSSGLYFREALQYLSGFDISSCSTGQQAASCSTSVSLLHQLTLLTNHSLPTYYLKYFIPLPSPYHDINSVILTVNTYIRMH